MSDPIKFDPEKDQAGKENIAIAQMLEAQGLAQVKSCYDFLSTKTAQEIDDTINAARQSFAAARCHLDAGIQQLLQRDPQSV